MTHRPEATQFIDDVRHATRAPHQRIESRLGDDGSPWTLDRYRRLLQMTYAVIAPLELHLAERLGPVFAAPPPLTRAQCLEADLVALGASLPNVEQASVPVASLSDAIGAGYVLQGSLLGGAIISRQLRHDCGAVRTSYLELYGRHLGAAWARYCAAVNEFGSSTSEADRQQVIASALRTFEAFDLALDALS